VRNGAARAGETYFDRFFFSRQIAEGSRLRLFIRPANGLAQQRHYNGAGPVSLQSRADAQTAVVKLLSGPQMPSAMVLPVAAPPMNSSNDG